MTNEVHDSADDAWARYLLFKSTGPKAVEVSGSRIRWRDPRQAERDKRPDDDLQEVVPGGISEMFWEDPGAFRKKGLEELCLAALREGPSGSSVGGENPVSLAELVKRIRSYPVGKEWSEGNALKQELKSRLEQDGHALKVGSRWRYQHRPHADVEEMDAQKVVQAYSSSKQTEERKRALETRWRQLSEDERGSQSVRAWCLGLEGEPPSPASLDVRQVEDLTRKKDRGKLASHVAQGGEKPDMRVLALLMEAANPGDWDKLWSLADSGDESMELASELLERLGDAGCAKLPGPGGLKNLRLLSKSLASAESPVSLPPHAVASALRILSRVPAARAGDAEDPAQNKEPADKKLVNELEELLSPELVEDESLKDALDELSRPAGATGDVPLSAVLRVLASSGDVDAGLRARVLRTLPKAGAASRLLAMPEAWAGATWPALARLLSNPEAADLAEWVADPERASMDGSIEGQDETPTGVSALKEAVLPSLERLERPERIAQVLRAPQAMQGLLRDGWLTDQLDSLREEQSEVQRLLGDDARRDKIKRLERKVAEIEEELTKKARDLDDAEREKSRLEDSLGQVKDEVARQKADLKTKEGEIERLQEVLHDASEAQKLQEETQKKKSKNEIVKTLRDGLLPVMSDVFRDPGLRTETPDTRSRIWRRVTDSLLKIGVEPVGREGEELEYHAGLHKELSPGSEAHLKEGDRVRVVYPGWTYRLGRDAKEPLVLSKALIERVS